MSFSSSSPAANPFLVDSLIGACRTDSFYSNGNMYMPSGSDMHGTYGTQTCGLLPSFGIRAEVAPQNTMSVHSYIPQIETWTDPSRTCRTEQTNCTFPQSIKEESNCCMYSDKRVQKEGYSNVIAEPCAGDGPEIPVPGYFRLSQTYANGKHPENYCHESPSPNPTLAQLSSVTPKPQHAISSSSSGYTEAEKNVRDLETTPNTPIRGKSPDQLKSCSDEKNEASTPELLLQKEGKGGLNEVK